MIPLTTEINPLGATTEQRQNELIRQLRIQNEELKVIINDIYNELNNIKEGKG
ncbi:MAG: hypothetical protein IJ002_03165 [Clostridia bacterium]|nr:hypothetical protein [Clostridia bacterium]MBQ8836492.1 hypothetical protein [Clostridia bacterium]